MSGKRAKEKRRTTQSQINKYFKLTEFDGELDNLIKEYNDLQGAISDIIERLKWSISLGSSYPGYIWNVCLSDAEDLAYVNITILFSGQDHYYMSGKGYSKNWEDNTSKPGLYGVTQEEKEQLIFSSLSKALNETKRLIELYITENRQVDFYIKKGEHEILYVRTFEGRY